MERVRLLADEHIPGPFLTAVTSLGYEVLRAKEEFPEGTANRRLLEYPEDAANGVDRIATTMPAAELLGNEFYLSDWI